MADPVTRTNILVLTAVISLCLICFCAVEGTNLSYAVTDNIGDCARTCLNSSCLLIFWKEQGLPGASLSENCGPQPPSLNPTQIQGVNKHIDPDVKVYLNHEMNQTSTTDPECATFVYIKPGGSISFSTPPSFTFGVCSIVLVTDENSSLALSGNLTCVSNCSCSDSLKLHNSLQLHNHAPIAVTACLEAQDTNTTGVAVTSGPGAYLVLELSREMGSLASFDVIAQSWPDMSSAPAFDELVKYSNSYLHGPECFGPRGYLPSCNGAYPINPVPFVNIGQISTTEFVSTTTEDPATSTTTISADGTITSTTDNITTTAENNSDSISSTATAATIITTSTDNYSNNNNNNKTRDNSNETTTSNFDNNNNDNNTTNSNGGTTKIITGGSSSNNSTKNNPNSVNKQVSGGSSVGLSPGIIAGVAVACLLAIVLVGLLSYLAFWRTKTHKVNPGIPGNSEHVMGSQPPTSTAVHAATKGTTAI